MPVGTPPLPEAVAVKVTLIPVPTVAEDEVSVVELATFAAIVKEKEATAVAGMLSESAT